MTKANVSLAPAPTICPDPYGPESPHRLAECVLRVDCKLTRSLDGFVFVGMNAVRKVFVHEFVTIAKPEQCAFVVFVVGSIEMHVFRRGDTKQGQGGELSAPDPETAAWLAATPR